MKKLIYTFCLNVIICLSSFSQNVGIGTKAPAYPLHILSSDSNLLLIDRKVDLSANLSNGILFGYNAVTSNLYRYAGAIKVIGKNIQEARLGFYTYASNLPSGLLERMSIMDDGNVGIGTTNPLYRLHVANGSSYFSGNVGVQTAPTGSYSFDVSGATRLQGDVRIDGILNPNNPLAIGNNTTIEGTLTVENGKGIVRSTSGTQMKIKRTSIGLSFSALGAGSTVASGFLGFGESFSAVTVSMGQCFNGTGDWAKLLIVPFNIDLVNNRCQFNVTNTSNSAINFTGNWDVLLVGN